MDTNFDAALKLILQFEGGYVNDPADKGGATNKGVTQRVYDAYRQTQGKQVQSVQNITDVEIRDIYYTNYWLVAKCDKLPDGVDTLHFDAAVNSGPTQAAKFLQRAIGVKDDGVIGDITLGKIATTNVRDIVKAYVGTRSDFYVDLAIRDASQLRFLKGWLRRVLQFVA